MSNSYYSADRGIKYGYPRKLLFILDSVIELRSHASVLTAHSRPRAVSFKSNIP
jgi:hypothetical protein